MGVVRNNIKRLRLALMSKGYPILLSQNEFFIDGVMQPISKMTIKIRQYDYDTDKYVVTKLYSSTSMLNIVFFLRDFLYMIQHKELPMDNEKWIKERADNNIEKKLNKVIIEEGDVV